MRPSWLIHGSSKTSNHKVLLNAIVPIEFLVVTRMAMAPAVNALLLEAMAKSVFRCGFGFVEFADGVTARDQNFPVFNNGNGKAGNAPILERFVAVGFERGKIAARVE